MKDIAMMHADAKPPVVLAFSVLDPSGSGGIQADIETAASLGCHCAPVITAMCAHGSPLTAETVAVDPTLIIEQARSILSCMDVRAIKIGFLGSHAIAEAVHSILQDYDRIPVVSHPGLVLLDDENSEHNQLVDAYSNLILPTSSIASFTLYEAREIAQELDTIETTAHELISSGCQIALISGTGKHAQDCQNSAYNAKGLMKDYHWQQESFSCFGANSTLTMSLASYLAHGFDELQALEQAQHFTCQTMHAARNMGFKQATPHRLFWADKNTTKSTSLSGSQTH